MPTKNRNVFMRVAGLPWAVAAYGYVAFENGLY